MLLDSPNLPESFDVSPITCRDQKDIAHASPFGSKSLHYTLRKILRSKCDLSDEDFSKLTIVDYFVLLLQCRGVFIDNEISRQFNCSCENSVGLNITISTHLTEIDRIFNINHQKEIMFDGGSLTFDVPSIDDLMLFLETPSADLPALFFRSYNSLAFGQLTLTERKECLASLPLDQYVEFMQLYSDFNKLKVENYIFCKCGKCQKETKEDLRFSHMLDRMESILFSFDYENCVLEYAVISKKLNISVDYLETTTPFEKKKYLDFLSEGKKSEEVKNAPSAAEELVMNSEFGF